MKFQMSGKILADNLKKVAAVTSEKLLPILQGVKVDVLDNHIIVTGSNGDESIINRFTSDCLQVDDVGSFIFGKSLINTLQKARGLISIDVMSNILTLSFENDKGEFEFPVLDAIDFPNIKFDGGTPILIDPKEFKKAVNYTAYAASTGEMRPILQAVHISKNENGYLCFTATDSHRLAKYEWSTVIEEEIQHNVPARILDNISKSINENDDTAIMFSTHQFAVRSGNTIFISRLLEGEFPDTNRLIPTEFTSTLRVNRKELLDSLDILKELSSEKNKGLIRLEVTDMDILIYTNAQQKGKGKVSMFHSDFSGEKITVGMSNKFVLDCLKSHDSTDVWFKFQAPLRPVIITPAGESEVNCTSLVLPVRQS